MEFDRQITTLLAKGYPAMAGKTEKEFLSMVKPLKKKLDSLSFPQKDLTKGILPFVIVVTNSLIPTELMMGAVLREGKTGTTKLFPHESLDFTPIDSVSISQKQIYILGDIDRGNETINVRPQDAFLAIQKKKRSPLTIDEGIALVTQFPEFLMKNYCFSLLASRVHGNQRVPAIWINAQKHPHLGWCWDGNPHTWLGSASCKYRIF